MKIIFLDIDGVIVTDCCQLLKRLHPEHANCAPSCVKALNRIISTTGAEIVLSSTWRTQWSLSELREILNIHFGIVGRVIDRTPSLETAVGVSAERHEEIEAWLQHRRPYPIESFVILDDNGNLRPRYKSQLVQTLEEEGLTEDDADRAIRMLSRSTCE